MKRIFVSLLIVAALFGCGKKNDSIQPASDLRSKLQNADGCRFDAHITADYGDATYTFVLNCQTDKDGKLRFEVSDPLTIAGMTGTISAQKGEILFDDKVLAFDTFADGYISPISAPWVMMNSLIGGYITSCGRNEEGYRISLNDSYADDALQLDVWTDGMGNPVQCDILYKERRCLAIVVKNFTFM